jgi:ElaB/YqjD/DUF883 family membrane-anchored ribosome-binding protein
MAEQTELILKQMDETRASMVEKVEALERQVADTVKETAATVAETVHTATEAVDKTVTTVSGTVEAVTETFNLRGHIERHPWIALGGAVALGYLAGSLLRGRRRSYAPEEEPVRPSRREREGSTAASESSDSVLSSEKSSSSTSPLGKVFEQIKGMAIGSAMGISGQILASALPDTMKEQVSTVVDEVTHYLGGTPQKDPEHSPTQQ